MTFDVAINHWHAVAAWTWNAGDDVCGICRAPFDACPPEAKYPGDDAPVVWGVCSHAFHIQCINRWLATQHPEQKCPFCRQPWEFKQADVVVEEHVDPSDPDGPPRIAAQLLSTGTPTMR